MIGALALSAKRGECKDLGVALQRIFGVTCGLDTDRIFYEIFRKHPDWLRELTELPLPAGCRGSAMALKQLESAATCYWSHPQARIPTFWSSFSSTMTIPCSIVRNWPGNSSGSN